MTGSWRIEPARNGRSSLVRPDGTWCESRFRPDVDAARRAAEAGVSDGDRVILVGFGGGELPRAILGRVGASGRLFVAEPECGILAAVRACADTRSLLDDTRLEILCCDPSGSAAGAMSRILLVPDPASFGEALSEVLKDGAFDRYIAHPSLAWPPGFEELRQRVEDLEVRRVSALHAGERLEENTRANRDRFLAAPGVAELSGVLAGATIVVAGGGLSLEPLAREIGDDADWIATGRSLATLVALGIRPHLAVFTDPLPAVAAQLAGLDPASIPPSVVFPTTSREAVALIPRLVAAFAEGAEGRALAPLREEIGELPAGGSVVTTSVGVAVLLGARRIALAGVDLTEPGGRSHARGAAQEANRALSAGRFGSLESQDARRERGLRLTGDRLSATSVGGEDLPTRKNLLLYARALRDLVARYRAVEFIQFSSVALPIESVAPSRPASAGLARHPFRVPTGTRVRQNGGLLCR